MFPRLEDGEHTKVKIKIGKYLHPIEVTRKGHRYFFQFGFNKAIMAEIKSMSGAKWHGFDEVPLKQWSIPINQRNHFQLDWLTGSNPYEKYDRPLIEAETSRKCYKHQVEMFRHMITRRCCVVAGEMGSGKTLAAIEAIEYFLMNERLSGWMYCAPKAALAATRLEFEIWKSLIHPVFVTYEGLKSLVQNWPSGSPAPQGVIFDESSRLKTPTAQRTEAAQHLADSIRKDWGDKAVVIEMSGSPAPKSPVDWWSQCEIACPGFLKEGTATKLQENLAILKEEQNVAGQAFKKIVGWRDADNKCSICGQSEEAIEHSPMYATAGMGHAFVKSVNEVHRLYRRMNGLVIVKFKKDCLDLPEKQYKIIEVKPSQETLRAAKLITKGSPRAVTALTLLRELSDGFQYNVIESGTKVCPLCNGGRTCEDYKYVGPDDEYDDVIERRMNGQEVDNSYFEKITMACTLCAGAGEIVNTTREVNQVPCPKEDALVELIEQHEEVGRLVCYAGFTGSVDRCVSIFKRLGWQVIKVDGRGWDTDTGLTNNVEMLKAFQYKKDLYPRLAFVGHPTAAGMGLTLTASPSIVYYSNDFNGESRTQSEDRIHRPGMDVNRGATIFDIIHLPTDKLVLDNLKKKRELEKMSLGEINALQGFRDV